MHYFYRSRAVQYSILLGVTLILVTCKGLIKGERVAGRNKTTIPVPTPTAASVSIFETSKLSLGNVLLGTTRSFEVKIKNPYDSELLIEGISTDSGATFTGGSFPGHGGTCPGSIKAGSSCNMFLSLGAAKIGSGSIEVPFNLSRGGIKSKETLLVDYNGINFLWGQDNYDADDLRGLSNCQNWSVAAYGERYLLSQQCNNRILIWNKHPVTGFERPDYVIGQSDISNSLVSANAGGVSSRTLSSPVGIHVSESGKLFVVDASNHRILIWNSIPTSNNAPADLVLGQATFNDSSANRGGAAAANTLNNPLDVHTHGNRLIVADSYNHRALIWNSIPITNGAAADTVLGQPDKVSMIANNGGLGLSTLQTPLGIAIDGSHVYVADTFNSRALIWNNIPTTDGEAADVVLGQVDGTSSGLSNLAAPSLSVPHDIVGFKNGIAVADTGNNRILVWDAMPSSNTPPTAVLGQPSTTSSTFNNGVETSRVIGAPVSLSVLNNALYVTDKWGAAPTRIWKTQPIGLAPAADQMVFSRGRPFYRSVQPTHVFAFDSKLYVSEWLRGMIWDSIPTDSTERVNRLIGAISDVEAVEASQGVTDKSLSWGMRGIGADSKYIYYPDMGHHRVLVFPTSFTSNRPAAEYVLGQSTFTTSSANAGGLSASALNAPTHAFSDGSTLVITDRDNNRVLIFSTLPTTNKASASIVVGQPNFGTSTANNGGVSAASLSSPTHACIDSGRLFVVDTGNNRVLIWNSLSGSSGQAADVVLGQTSFTAVAANTGGVKASTFNSPQGIDCRNSRLAVADSGNHRVLYWKSIPTMDGQAADRVFGQADFTLSAPNQGLTSLTSSSLNAPNGLTFFQNQLIVTDPGNSRLIGFWIDR